MYRRWLAARTAAQRVNDETPVVTIESPQGVANCEAIAACRKHGKFLGMDGMYTPELLERHVGMGVQLVLSGSDFRC